MNIVGIVDLKNGFYSKWSYTGSTSGWHDDH